MSFSVSYSAKEYDHQRWYHSCTLASLASSALAPYDDWVARGRPADTIMTYSMHYCDDILRYYYMPSEKMAYMSFGAEFDCDVTVTAQLRIDDRAKTIEVDRLHCVRDNYWEDKGVMGAGQPMVSGVGGIGWYKKQLDYMGYLVSFEAFAAKFFAPGWTFLKLPITRPHLSPEVVALAKTCHAKMGGYRSGPWGKTVGTYLVHRNAAATTIQKHFRGWRVRMVTAFNPTTPIGAYFALRDFWALRSQMM